MYAGIVTAFLAFESYLNAGLVHPAAKILQARWTHAVGMQRTGLGYGLREKQSGGMSSSIARVRVKLRGELHWRQAVWLHFECLWCVLVLSVGYQRSSVGGALIHQDAACRAHGIRCDTPFLSHDDSCLGLKHYCTPLDTTSILTPHG